MADRRCESRHRFQSRRQNTKRARAPCSASRGLGGRRESTGPFSCTRASAKFSRNRPARCTDVDVHCFSDWELCGHPGGGQDHPFLAKRDLQVSTDPSATCRDAFKYESSLSVGDRRVPPASLGCGISESGRSSSCSIVIGVLAPGFPPARYVPSTRVQGSKLMVRRFVFAFGLYCAYPVECVITR